MNLPSWVPDLSIETFGSPINGRELWSASLGLDCQGFQFLPQDRLQVSGVKVAVLQNKLTFKWTKLHDLAEFLQAILELSQIHHPDQMDIEMWKVHKEGSRSAMSASHLNFQEQSRFEVLWRTLTLDCFRGEHPAALKCGEAIVRAFKYLISVRQQMVDFAQLFTLPISQGNPSLGQAFVNSNINVKAISEFDIGTAEVELARSYAAIEKNPGRSLP
jgi:hypothetical protein